MKKDLVSKLQNIVKSQSVNSLGGVYPTDLLEWLDISGTELKELVGYLHDERIITYKYRFKCECGEFCTIYEHKLLHDDGLFCEVCGEFYSLEDVQEKSEILYKIDKQELLDIDKAQVDFKVLSSTKGKIVPITRMNEEEKAKMDKKKIFLGSSSEAEKTMENIAYQLQTLDCDTYRWNEDGKNIFPAGHNIIDSLIKITKMVDAAVFIFNEDDKIWNKKSAVTSVVRDNVLLEYGLFAGVLGKEKVCMICKGEVHIPSDLLGIKYINGSAGDMIIKKQLEDWLNAM